MYSFGEEAATYHCLFSESIQPIILYAAFSSYQFPITIDLAARSIAFIFILISVSHVSQHI